MKTHILTENKVHKRDDFLPAFNIILTKTKWIGIPTYGGKVALSWAIIVLFMLIVVEVVSLWKLIGPALWKTSNSLVARLSGFLFYGNGLLSHILSWRIVNRWKSFSYYWLHAETSGYDVPPDATIKKRLVYVTVFLAVSAFVEHMLSMMSAICWDCPPNEYLKSYILSSHGFLIHEQEYSWWLAIPVFILSKSATILWNFQDLLIILISMGLASRYHRLNRLVRYVVRVEKRAMFRKKHTFSQYHRLTKWRRIREAYVQQAAIVRKVDEELGALILLSNCNNLYFICLQLFLGLKTENATAINIIYYLVSLSWLLCRACSVVLAAADVSLHSKRALSTLNSCPNSSFNVEIKRLKYQLAYDNVALSGKGFFYLQREILLEVAAAVLKYELILIQYDK